MQDVSQRCFSSFGESLTNQYLEYLDEFISTARHLAAERIANPLIEEFQNQKGHFVFPSNGKYNRFVFLLYCLNSVS